MSYKQIVMVKMIQIVFFLMFSVNCFSQLCSDRFDRLITEDVHITNDIVFGNNVTLTNRNVTLAMDVYEPVEEVSFNRPLLILAHGGAFITGNRRDLAELCEAYAQRGFVAATIDYRLIDDFVGAQQDSLVYIDGVLDAVMDMRAAVRYFKEEAAGQNTFQIDTNYIIVGGVSAGGVTATNMVYLDEEDSIPDYLQTILDKNAGLEGNSSENTSISSSVYGVLNFSGSIFRDFWMENNPDKVNFAAHDDGDRIVPCGFDATSLISAYRLNAYGSCAIDEYLDSLGYQNKIVRIENSDGHVSFLNTTEKALDIVEQSSLYLKQNICNLPVNNNDFEIKPQFSVYPNPSDGKIFISTEEQMLINIYNNLGALVLRNFSVSSFEELEIDVTDWDAGIYWIQAGSRRGVSTRKIIVQ